MPSYNVRVLKEREKRKKGKMKKGYKGKKFFEEGGEDGG